MVLGTVLPATADPPWGCKGTFAFSYTREYKPGDWALGAHEYQIKVYEPISEEWWTNPPMYFNVAEEAPLIDGQVNFRGSGVETKEGTVVQINPDQDSVMQLTFINIFERDLGEQFRESVEVEFSVDNGEFEAISPGPLTAECGWNNPGRFNRSWGSSH